LIYKHSLTCELIGYFFKLSMEIVESVNSLTTLQIEFETILSLMFLKEENEFVYGFEDFRLVNFLNLLDLISIGSGIIRRSLAYSLDIV
jgi:hypothetical protein